MADERLTLVSSNLQEAFDKDDVAQRGDVALFAQRVTRVVPSTPDVVLLQEVGALGAQSAADLLSKASGARFNVALAAGPGELLAEESVRDTAILLNRATVEPADPGGFERTRHTFAEGAGQLPTAKDHARLLVRHRSTGGHLALISLHFLPEARFASRPAASACRLRWCVQLMQSLGELYGLTPKIIAGDFNGGRCVTRPETVECSVTPFWSELVGRGYKDAVFVAHRNDAELQAQVKSHPESTRARIDYIFTQLSVVDALHDVGYEARPGDPGFYSNHRFLWAVLQLPEHPAPSPLPRRGGWLRRSFEAIAELYRRISRGGEPRE